MLSDDELAGLLQLLVRAAVREGGLGLSNAIREFRVMVIGDDLATIHEALDRAKRSVAWLTLEVQQLKAENWDLAVELARQRREQETRDHERHEADHRGSGSADGVGRTVCERDA